MKHAILGTLLTGLLAGGAATAQYRDAYGNPYPGGRYPNAERDRGAYGYGSSYDPIRRSLSDLDRAASIRFADRHERRHYESARHDLMRFAENRDRGRFDRDRLDGALGHLSHLVRSAQLHPRDREMLARDMDALRDLRARGGYYGGYRDDRRW